MRWRIQGEEFNVSPYDFDQFDAEQRAWFAAEAEFLLPDGTPMTGAALEFARTYMARDTKDYSDLRREREASRWLIPGLQRWGTIAMLGGNPKAGKSTCTVDYVATLLTPERRFLDHFGPVDLGADPRHPSLYVWLINCENPAADYERALVDAGIDLSSVWLKLIHLDDRGGAGELDITDQVKWDNWAREMVECNECDGTDFWTPSVVIVDGLTAILQDAGKGTEDYGLWGAAFQRLLRASDVPNGLVVVHNTLQGDHAMGGTPAGAWSDGNWTYKASYPDNPLSPRLFRVHARIGGESLPEQRVDLVDGRLVLRASAAHEQRRRPPQESSDSIRDDVVERVTKAMPDGIRTTDLTEAGRVGKLRREAMTRLADEGVIHSKPDGLAKRWYLTEPA